MPVIEASSFAEIEREFIVGYDPTPIFQSPKHPDFGLLKLTPWRIKLADRTGKGTTYFWRPQNPVT